MQERTVISDGKRTLGDFDGERFERLKADFIAATSEKERKRVLGELMNDSVREQFKRWVPDQQHASSVVQDYFMGLILDFDPKKFVPSEERDEKKKKIEYFDEFADLDYFIHWSRKRLGWIFCAHMRQEAKTPTLAEPPEVAVDGGVDELIEREHVDYILKCFQTEFSEKEYFIFASHALEEWTYPKIAAWWRAERGDETIDQDKARRIYHKVEERCVKIWGWCMQGRYYTLRFDPARRADLGKLNDGVDDDFGKFNDDEGDDDGCAGSPAKLPQR